MWGCLEADGERAGREDMGVLGRGRRDAQVQMREPLNSEGGPSETLPKVRPSTSNRKTGLTRWWIDRLNLKQLHE